MLALIKAAEKLMAWCQGSKIGAFIPLNIIIVKMTIKSNAPTCNCHSDNFMLPESSMTLQENIYRTGITYDHHL